MEDKRKVHPDPIDSLKKINYDTSKKFFSPHFFEKDLGQKRNFFTNYMVNEMIHKKLNFSDTKLNFSDTKLLQVIF